MKTFYGLSLNFLPETKTAGFNLLYVCEINSVFNRRQPHCRLCSGKALSLSRSLSHLLRNIPVL